MREQTSILRLFDLIARTIDKPSKFIDFLLLYLSNTDLIIEKFERSIRICEDASCSRYAIVTYNPTVEIISNSRKISKLLANIAVKYLATNGEKKIVLLYMLLSNGKYVRLSNILKVKSEKFCIFGSRMWNIVIALVAVIVAFVSSITFRNLLVTMMFVVFSSILISSLSLINAYRSSRGLDLVNIDILKISILCSWNTPDSLIKSLLRLLRGLDEINNETIRTVINLSRIVLGKYYIDTVIDHIKLEDSVLSILRKLKAKVLLINSDSCNAFTLPIFKYIIITTKLIAVLNNVELSAVIAHEIGHIVNNDFLKSLVLFLLNTLIIYGIVCEVVSMNISLLSIAFIMATYTVISTLALFMIFRRFEFQADRVAIKLVNAEHLISALLKVGWRCLIVELDKPFTLFLSKIISTHPPILERVLRSV